MKKGNEVVEAKVLISEVKGWLDTKTSLLWKVNLNLYLYNND